MKHIEDAKDKLAFIIVALESPAPLQGHETRGLKAVVQSALNDLFDVKVKQA